MPAFLAGVVLLKPTRLHFLFWAIAGFAWTSHCAHARLGDRLPPAMLGRDIELTGWIDGFPSPSSAQVTFSFAVSKPRAAGVPQRIRLTWYDPPPGLAAGTWLAVVARLKPPRGLRNPGGFDYERWLLTEGYGATGYVRSARIEAGAPSLQRSWLLLRARLADRYAAAAPDASAAALLTALAIGERFRFTEETWRDFRVTGTTHLVAVSGMHVALLGLVVFVGLRWLFVRLPARLAARDLEVAAAASALATLGYAALTGFALPAQRSLMMIVVALAIVVSRREIAPVQELGRGFARNPDLRPFCASVGVVLAVVCGRCVPDAARGAAHSRVPAAGCARGSLPSVDLTRMQWAISLALLPLTALFFAEISLIGPAVNLLAIPLFNLVLVPLALLATLLTPLATAGDVLIFGAGVLASTTLLALHHLATLPWASLALAPPGFWAAAITCSAALFAIAAPPLPARRLAWLALLPLCFPSVSRLPRGAVRVVMLDVGHGLAVLIETREHRLLFDAGPRFPSGFDSGERIALPALSDSGRRALDRLIVSHADNDHSGGAAAILRALPDVVALVGPDVTTVPGRRCERGQRWIWNDVTFTILHPPGDFRVRGNDSSCVLRVAAHDKSVLIAADIEARGERALRAVPDLAAEVVIVPHHGSASSSSADFVAATRPRWALVSAAHANRWGFPRPDVRQRWEQQGAAVLVTGDSGAITIELDAHGTRRPDRTRPARPLLGSCKLSAPSGSRVTSDCQHVKLRNRPLETVVSAL